METIHNLSEYVKLIKDIYGINGNLKNRLWYRGHSKEEYKLLPSIFREPYIQKVKIYEEVFKNDFKARAVPYMNEVPVTDLDWMFLMQHYSIPTRLLDWSEDALIALLFALKNHKIESNQNAVVWVLNPYELNKKVYSKMRLTEFSHGELIIPNITNNNVSNEMLYKYYVNEPIVSINIPLAILPPKNNKRIIAQKGMFTLFPIVENAIELNKIVRNEEFLWKIEIYKDNVKAILEELHYLGINETSLFPGLDSVASEIISEYKGKL